MIRTVRFAGLPAGLWRAPRGPIRFSRGRRTGRSRAATFQLGRARSRSARPFDPLELVVVGGAYVALLPARLDTRNVFAVFRDDNGAIVPVRRVDAEVLARHLITDTDTVCPACGECDWEAIRYEPALIRVSPARRSSSAECADARKAEGAAPGAVAPTRTRNSTERSSARAIGGREAGRGRCGHRVRRVRTRSGDRPPRPARMAVHDRESANLVPGNLRNSILDDLQTSACDLPRERTRKRRPFRAS